jgi:hypothetical protein
MCRSGMVFQPLLVWEGGDEVYDGSKTEVWRGGIVYLFEMFYLIH